MAKKGYHVGALRPGSTGNVITAEEYNALKPVQCPCGTMVNAHRRKAGLTRCHFCQKRCINA